MNLGKLRALSYIFEYILDVTFISSTVTSAENKLLYCVYIFFLNQYCIELYKATTIESSSNAFSLLKSVADIESL